MDRKAFQIRYARNLPEPPNRLRIDGGQNVFRRLRTTEADEVRLR